MPPKAKASRAASPSSASAASSAAGSAESGAASAAPASAAGSQSQQLPSKEQTLFKQILKYYETKQYKKALKAADVILKRQAAHGETLAMKGLVLSQLKRGAEAHALVKRGLAANMNSHVCWHVYGLLHRSEGAYDQAIKCYQNALKKDPNNLQILKDLSALQVQTRHHDGFAETRRRLLLLKTNNRNNWLAFAVGTQLAGRPDRAVDILDSFIHTQETEDEVRRRKERERDREAKDDDSRPQPQHNGISAVGLQEAVEREIAAFEGRSRAHLASYEDSELFLYRLSLLVELGQLQAALLYLDSIADRLCDSLAYLESRARLLSQLQRQQEAELYYRHLLRLNPDCLDYHRGLQAALGLDADSAENSERLLSLYQSLQQQFPLSSLCRRLPLDFTRGSVFRSLLEPYMAAAIRRAIPSLFVDLRPLYREQAKAAAIEAVVQAFLHSLQTTARFPTIGRGAEGEVNEQQQAEVVDEPESPSCLLWTLFFAAQHFDHQGRPLQALSLLSAAVSHTPTLVELYMLQARVYKHAGDAEAAFACMDLCRSLDTADRYLNTKAVRYALRAGKRKEAEELVSLFLRDDAAGLQALSELQVMWWEWALGCLQQRQGDHAAALHSFRLISRHFHDIFEDQFDFHTYCLRKSTLRAYIAMLRWEDGIRGHKFFVRACVAVIRLHLLLWDERRETERRQKAELDDATLSEDERKLRLKQQKKQAAKDRKRAIAAEEERKAAEEAARRKAAAAAGGRSAGAVSTAAEADPQGAALLSLDHLLEATRFLRFLQLQSASLLDTALLALQLSLRKQRWLLVWKAVKQATRAQPDSAELHEGSMRFLLGVQAAWSGMQPVLQKLLQDEWAEEGRSGAAAAGDEQEAAAALLHQADVAALNSLHLQRFGSSLEHRFAVARVLLFLSKRGAAVELLSVRALPAASTSSSDELELECTVPPACRLAADSVSLQLAIRVHRWLQDDAKDDDAARAWAAQLRAIFPLAVQLGASSAAADIRLLAGNAAADGSASSAAAAAQSVD